MKHRPSHILRASSLHRIPCGRLDEPIGKRKRALLCLGGIGSLLLAACGAGTVGSAVRPSDPTAGDVLGKKCTSVAAAPQLLTLDWEDTQRIDLERAMAKHVAVVHYDCGSFKVLQDCEVDGTYEYAGVSPAKTVAKLADADQVSANLPIGAASMSGAVQRGATIDIVYLAVGQLASTANEVPRSALKGRCDGATHTVRTANLGAFALATGTHGSANAAVALLGRGAAASSSSDKDIQRANGDLDACNGASDSATTPTPKCKALVQLLLSPIQNGSGGSPSPVASAPHDSKAPPSAGATSGDPGSGKLEAHKTFYTKALKNPCNEGFRLAKDGVCTRPEKAQAYLCDGANLDECKAQCDKGDARSCYNAAANRLASPGNADERNIAIKDELAFLDKSCSLGFGAACTDLGMALWGMGNDVKKAETLFTKACSKGEGPGCVGLASMYVGGGHGFTKDPAMARKLYERGCSLGVESSCKNASRMYADGVGGSKDVAMAAKLMERASRAQN